MNLNYEIKLQITKPLSEPYEHVATVEANGAEQAVGRAVFQILDNAPASVFKILSITEYLPNEVFDAKHGFDV